MADDKQSESTKDPINDAAIKGGYIKPPETVNPPNPKPPPPPPPPPPKPKESGK